MRSTVFSRYAFQARRFGTQFRNSDARPHTVWRYSAVVPIAALAYWTMANEPIRSDAAMVLAFSVEELKKHNSKSDCWIAIDGQVYDVSQFVASHPGGAARIMMYAGGDASSAFGKIHTHLVLRKMKEHITCLGPLEGEFAVVEKEVVVGKPPLAQIFNLLDFEYVAQKVLPQTTFTYYATGASDEFTLRENHYAYLRVFFRPKALQNVDNVTTATTMLGIPSELPLYISGFAGSLLAHPDAEWNLQRAAYSEGIVQMVPRQISIDLDEFYAGVPSDQKQWCQLHFYSSAEMEDMDKYLNQIHSYDNIKGIFFNVDVVDLGNREKDTKIRAQDDNMLEELKHIADNGVVQYCRTFTWDHLATIISKTHLPVGLKGVQRGEDVVKAAELGVSAVILSNHGGRQLDFSRPPLEVLAEARQMLKEKGLEDKIEIYLDGGVRRGSDIVKALCMGAKGVGLGRPFLYAMAGYGEPGVSRAINILRGEIRNNMMLLGAASVEDLTEDLVDVSGLKYRSSYVNDRLYDGAYQPLAPPPWQAAK